MALLTTTSPAPGLLPVHAGSPVRNAYFAVTIDAAADLLEAREYEGLPRPQRLAKALDEQRAFLAAFSDPALNAALDLRIIVDPRAATPVSVALLGRVWGAGEAEVTARAERLCAQIHSSLPRHVTGTPVLDDAEVGRLLAPLGDAAAVDSALITRHELLGYPSRPDAGVGYYFSAVPFNWAGTDWSGLYSTLAASTVPLVLAAGVLPVRMPPAFAQQLLALATFYGRLAREDEQEGGLYFGRQKLAPDAFAVDAERAFRDFARRFGQQALVLRTQVTAAGQLPPGIAETVAATISPPDPGDGTQLERERAAAAYEVRRPATAEQQRIAERNLRSVDFGLLPGSPEIWGRPDPPDPQLQLLSVLGDARDAACSFRLPVAVDGTVPGFRVRRGYFGHAEAFQTTGPALRIGQIPGTGRTVSFPVRSLTKHALIAGSTGSGKTTTAMEILRQLWLDHHIPFLVIEPVNSDADDYRRLAAEAGFEALEVCTIGDEGGRPIRFNPFEVPENVLAGEHTANLLECFKAAFGLWEPLPGIYQDALNLTYLRAGVLSSERADGGPRRWPTVVEFMRAMREVTAGLGYAGEVRANIEAASIRRAQQLVRGVTASAFLTNRPNDIRGLLDHPVILELKSLGSGDEQALMMALLLNAVTEYYQAVRGASADLAHVTVVEEAHRLLARPQGAKDAEQAQAKEKAAEAFANALAENRKYGEGVIIAEQVPSKIVQDAVKNTNLKIMHRLTAEDDRRYLGETMGLDEPQMRFATRLQTGEALTYSDEFAETTHVTVVPQVRPAPPGPAPRLPGPADLGPAVPEPAGPVAGVHGPVGGVPGRVAEVSGAAARAAVPPFTACGACRSQCTYRGAALAMVRDPRLVARVRDAVAALEATGLARTDVEVRWRKLLGVLHDGVTAFPALPAAGPGASDAEYCLFLHALAIRTMRFTESWPSAVARRLGIVSELKDRLLAASTDPAQHPASPLREVPGE